MKNKLIPMLGLAVVFGAISIYVADALVKAQFCACTSGCAGGRCCGPSVELKKIVIAKEPLRYGMELTSESLVEIDWPANAVPEGAFTSISELAVVGQGGFVVNRAK